MTDVENKAEETTEEETIKFDPTKKKKKKVTRKKDVEEEVAPSTPTVAEDAGDGASMELKENDEDIPSDEEAGDGEDTGDAEYNELLKRIFNLLHENNPDLVDPKGKKGKIILTIPEVFRSPKKTVWHNFQATCKHMNRPSDHFQQYCLAELGTTGTLDGNNRFVIRGRYNPKQLEIVQRTYIAEYVTCRNCKTHNTTLKKENRLYFIQCQMCGSTRTVAPIRTGFVAHVTKRPK